jgi:hypothetical protein
LQFDDVQFQNGTKILIFGKENDSKDHSPGYSPIKNGENHRITIISTALDIYISSMMMFVTRIRPTFPYSTSVDCSLFCHCGA